MYNNNNLKLFEPEFCYLLVRFYFEDILTKLILHQSDS